jgi:light-regulated signal transduction histidine kinase (bacteriophytochrome)
VTSAIQPCALMLVVGSDWRVETVSTNVGMLGDHKPASVIGEPLADVIGSKAIHSLRNRLAWLSSDESEVQDFGVEWGQVTLDIRAVRQGETYLIEAELAVEPRLPDGIGMVRSMSDRLVCREPLELAAQAIRQLIALTGFKQLMLCDGRGAVIASNQSVGPGASPEIAEITRLVADREAEQVPLVGDLNDGLFARAAFLAPDQDQLERMAARGIAASMTLPLKIDGEYVGAIHAFHPSPRRCGAERRSVAHLFAERLVARMARQGWKP